MVITCRYFLFIFLIFLKFVVIDLCGGGEGGGGGEMGRGDKNQGGSKENPTINLLWPYFNLRSVNIIYLYNFVSGSFPGVLRLFLTHFFAKW